MWNGLLPLNHFTLRTVCKYTNPWEIKRKPYTFQNSISPYLARDTEATERKFLRGKPSAGGQKDKGAVIKKS